MTRLPGGSAAQRKAQLSHGDRSSTIQPTSPRSFAPARFIVLEVHDDLAMRALIDVDLLRHADPVLVRGLGLFAR